MTMLEDFPLMDDRPDSGGVQPIVRLRDIRKQYVMGKAHGHHEAVVVHALRGVSVDFYPGEYVAIMAYLPISAENDLALGAIRLAIRDRLRVATTIAKLGIFEWHMLEDQAIWENEHMYEIFGHAPEDGTIGKNEFLNDILHPDDRPAVRRAISQALREDGDLHISGRIRRKSDGAWRRIDMAGRFERDAPGRRMDR